MSSLKQCHPAISPDDAEFHNPQGKNVSDVGNGDTCQQAISSRFFAKESGPAIRAVHVQGSDQEETECADDAEGDVEFWGFCSKERGFGGDEVTPVEPRQNNGDEVDVEEDERKGNAAEFKRDTTPIVVPHPNCSLHHILF